MYKMTPTEVPVKWQRPCKCQAVLREFLKMNTPAIKLDVGNEWRNPKSAYSSLRESARRFGYPVEVRMVHGEVYFIRIGD